MTTYSYGFCPPNDKMQNRVLKTDWGCILKKLKDGTIRSQYAQQGSCRGGMAFNPVPSPKSGRVSYRCVKMKSKTGKETALFKRILEWHASTPRRSTRAKVPTRQNQNLGYMKPRSPLSSTPSSTRRTRPTRTRPTRTRRPSTRLHSFVTPDYPAENPVFASRANPPRRLRNYVA
jgi:hypothetical protein